MKLRYYTWRNPQAAPRGPWLIAVHGISMDAREQVRLLQSMASRCGYSIAAPLFERPHYRGYQQLGIGSGRLRAAESLCALHDALMERFAAPAHFDLFGFSGGAQFSHRFAMAYPQRVRRLALASAGWYTLPQSAREFPYGVGASERCPRPDLNIAAFAEIPQLVLVGEDDVTRDKGLRKRRHLDREQGRHRIARARTWTSSMHQLARTLGISARTHLRLLPAVNHDFQTAVLIGQLDRHIFEFFTDLELSK